MLAWCVRVAVAHGWLRSVWWLLGSRLSVTESRRSLTATVRISRTRRRRRSTLCRAAGRYGTRTGWTAMGMVWRASRCRARAPRRVAVVGRGRSLRPRRAARRPRRVVSRPRRARPRVMVAVCCGQGGWCVLWMGTRSMLLPAVCGCGCGCWGSTRRRACGPVGPLSAALNRRRGSCGGLRSVCGCGLAPTRHRTRGTGMGGCWRMCGPRREVRCSRCGRCAPVGRACTCTGNGSGSIGSFVAPSSRRGVRGAACGVCAAAIFTARRASGRRHRVRYRPCGLGGRVRRARKCLGAAAR